MNSSNHTHDNENVISRRDYQEILLARMAGGDLYANEIRLKLRKLDISLDVLREKPLYPHITKKGSPTTNKRENNTQ